MSAPIRPRSARLRQKRTSSDAEPRDEYLSFRIADEMYAVPLARVHEILRLLPITVVPRAPEAVLGVISVRGQVVTVVDLRVKLGLGESELGPKSRILLVGGPMNEVVGVVVDEMHQVLRLEAREIETARAAFGHENSAVSGIARPANAAAGSKEAVVVLLDLQVALGS